MAFPMKRRKLSDEVIQPEPTDLPVAPITQGVQEVAFLATENQRTPPRIDEVHVRVRNHQSKRRRHIDGDAHHRNIHRRQTGGTASQDASASDPKVSQEPAISVSASLGVNGELTPITLTIPATSVVVPVPAASVSAAATVAVLPTTTTTTTTSRSTTPTTTTTTTTTTPATTPTPTTTTSDLTPVAPAEATSDSPNGMIGATPMGATPTPTTSLTTSDAVVPVTSTTSDAVVPVTSSTSETVIPVTSSAVLPSSTSSVAGEVSATTNSTITESPTLSSTSLTASITDATVVPASVDTNGTATGISTTATLTAASGTITASGNFTATSTDMSAIFGLLVSALPDGQFTTIPASASASLTTLPDGRVSTVFGGLVPITATSTGASATGTSSLGSSGTSSDSSSPTGSSSGGSNGSNGGSGSGTGSGSGSGSGASGSESGSGAATNTPPPQILAGGIVGGVAGIAAILLVALLFLRWYRRKSSMQRIDNGPSSGGAGNGSRGMTERAGLLPLASAAGGLFRGRQRVREEPSGERGFQKISGRKLPSAFSEGMVGPSGPAPMSPPPVPMPAAFENGAQNHNRNNGGSGGSGGNRSFYRDSQGYYGGVGVEESGSSGNTPPDEAPINYNAGPARQATLHPGGPYPASPNPFDTPPGSPRMPMLQGRSATPVNLSTLDRGYNPVRSETPHSHNSRFTEEV